MDHPVFTKALISIISIPQVTTVVFDKTGTLTHGRPTVASVCVFVEERVMSLARVVAAVGVAESGSEHPLGSAVVKGPFHI